MSKILDGRKTAEEILERLKEEVKKKRLRLNLAVIQVGEDPVSQAFVEQKRRACEGVGVGFRSFVFPASIGVADLKRKILKIARSPSNHGIVLQLPLPEKFSPDGFLNLIPEEKDVDVLSENGFMKFFRGASSVLPPVVGGIDFLFKKYGIGIKGKNVVIMGAGKLTGLPSAIWALQRKGTVSVVTASTKKPSELTKLADILISGVGKPGLIKGNMVKRGVAVIDCGTRKVGKKIKGDVDFKTVAKKASYITPVPGGVGPMTVAALLWNLVKMNKK